MCLKRNLLWTGEFPSFFGADLTNGPPEEFPPLFVKSSKKNRKVTN